MENIKLNDGQSIVYYVLKMSMQHVLTITIQMSIHSVNMKC